ncbi:hypothetical protein B0H13DRAFT_2375418 [Mycena leptocephala]|nr:hypothetical protein B0H13DRAFT_2375418 [Mycena leptocephala]
MRYPTSFLVLLCILGVLLIVMLTPPPTASSSSLAHRRTTGVRQARNDAIRSPYHSPRQHRLQRSPGRSPLQNVGNIPRPQIQNPVAGPSVEDEHSSFRQAERERQAALQETPSRRRRRIPVQPRNENRSPSPTASASRGAQSTSLGLGTPPDSQRPVLSARTLARRARREREAAAKAAGTSANRPPRPAPRPIGADGPGQLSVGQQARRQNERNARAVPVSLLPHLPIKDLFLLLDSREGNGMQHYYWQHEDLRVTTESRSK